MLSKLKSYKAIQITKDCRKFAKHMRLRTVCVYGGTGISEQIAELKRGAEVSFQIDAALSLANQVIQWASI